MAFLDAESREFDLALRDQVGRPDLLPQCEALLKLRPRPGQIALLLQNLTQFADTATEVLITPLGRTHGLDRLLSVQFGFLQLALRELKVGHPRQVVAWFPSVRGNDQLQRLLVYLFSRGEITLKKQNIADVGQSG